MNGGFSIKYIVHYWHNLIEKWVSIQNHPLTANCENFWNLLQLEECWLYYLFMNHLMLLQARIHSFHLYWKCPSLDILFRVWVVVFHSSWSWRQLMMKSFVENVVVFFTTFFTALVMDSAFNGFHFSAQCRFSFLSLFFFNEIDSFLLVTREAHRNRVVKKL